MRYATSQVEPLGRAATIAAAAIAMDRRDASVAFRRSDRSANADRRRRIVARRRRIPS
jgi:hypothetical protein